MEATQTAASRAAAIAAKAEQAARQRTNGADYFDDALDRAAGEGMRVRAADDALASCLSAGDAPASQRQRRRAGSNGADVAAGEIPFQWASQIADDASAEVREIVEGVLTAGGMSCMYGESNTGKSYAATDLGFCIARGVPWLGKRVERGAVIYVAGESAGSIRQRIRAYRKRHGTKLEAFGLVSTALNLLDPSADVDALIELVKAKASEIGESILLVIVDTLARAMPAADENSALDMGRLVAAGDRIRQATAAHVLYVHHSGKNSLAGARGSSALRAALDTELEVTKDATAKLHYIEVKKQRDLASAGSRLAARFVPIELGFNQWGNSVTACVVEHADSAQAPPCRSTKLPKGSEMLMAALVELASDSDRVSAATTTMPAGKRLVAVEAWRDRYYQRRGTTADEPASTRRNEWTRARKALVDAKKVGIWGQDAWIW